MDGDSQEENKAMAKGAEKVLEEFEAEQKNVKSARPQGATFTDYVAGFFTGFFKIRDEPTALGKAVMASCFFCLVMGAWFWVTRGAVPEDRLVSPYALGSPEEVFGSFHALWFDRALMRNLLASLGRVLEGFGLAVCVGVPLGILCGAFKRIDAFFMPISVFGRNVPIVALLPMAMLWFGAGESLKVGFLFISCVAFILFDTTQNINGVSKDYLDTAYTLGASRFQVLTKVLIPLALPGIVNSLRLLLGLAFGYIILAEMVDMDTGVGKLIIMSQRKGPREHVYLILFFITIVAFFIDRLLFMAQKYFFPYRFARRS